MLLVLYGLGSSLQSGSVDAIHVLLCCPFSPIILRILVFSNNCQEKSLLAQNPWDEEGTGWETLRLQQICNKAVVKTEMRKVQLNRYVLRPLELRQSDDV